MNTHFLGYCSEQKNQHQQQTYFSDRVPEDMMAMEHASAFPQPTPNSMISSNAMSFPMVQNMSFQFPHFQKSQLARSVPYMEDPIERLKVFLATAPSSWDTKDLIRRFPLGNGEIVSCIYWKGLFYVTGTDIVKILLFRFQFIQRPIINTKKFEEGIFSDLRNLKPGLDAALEEPRSEFLELLYRNGCIRTQKKQKVFYWYSVPHERLFVDALERDLKRESNLIHVNAFLGRHQACFPSYLPHKLAKVSPLLMSPAPLQHQRTMIPMEAAGSSHPAMSFQSHQPAQAPSSQGTLANAAPPLAIPQPIKASSGYFSHGLDTFFTGEDRITGLTSAKDFSVDKDMLKSHPSSMADTSFDDYFGSDLTCLSYSSNLGQRNTYAAVPDGVIKRPDLFDTFI
ncbi:hypothetical protein MDAP_002174 [Mitosporidium daphniae]